MSSRLAREKNVEVLIDALTHCSARKTAIAGDGPKREALESAQRRPAPIVSRFWERSTAIELPDFTPALTRSFSRASRKLKDWFWRGDGGGCVRHRGRCRGRFAKFWRGAGRLVDANGRERSQRPWRAVPRRRMPAESARARAAERFGIEEQARKVAGVYEAPPGADRDAVGS